MLIYCVMIYMCIFIITCVRLIPMFYNLPNIVPIKPPISVNFQPSKLLISALLTQLLYASNRSARNVASEALVVLLLLLNCVLEFDIVNTTMNIFI